MKREIYHKVVEYEDYKYQTEEIRLVDFFILLTGVFLGLLFFGMFFEEIWSVWIGGIGLLFMFGLASIKKRKVSYVKVK